MHQLRTSTFPVVISTPDNEKAFYRCRSNSLPDDLLSETNRRKTTAAPIKRIKSELNLVQKYESGRQPLTHKTGYLKDERINRSH